MMRNRKNEIKILVKMLAIVNLILLFASMMMITGPFYNISKANTTHYPFRSFSEDHEKIEILTDVSDRNPFEYEFSLLYQVRWLRIKAGFSEIILGRPLQFQGTGAYYCSARAWTNEFFSKFFPVDDLVESYIDQKNFLPHFYSERIFEGSQRRAISIEFNQKKQQIIQDGKHFPLKPQTLDPLSWIMFLRIGRFSLGQNYSNRIFAQKKMYQIDYSLGQLETVTTPLGAFLCFSVQPTLLLRGRPIQEDNKIKLWFTADENRLPVKFESKVKVGTVTAELTAITSDIVSCGKIN